MLANRIALYLTAAGDLVAAVAPFVLDFGGSEKIIAYAGSILALNAVVIKWLDGWQKYEALLLAPAAARAEAREMMLGAGKQDGSALVGVLLTVLVAALVYLLLAAITGSAIVAIVGAVLVLIAGIPAGGYSR